MSGPATSRGPWAQAGTRLRRNRPAMSSAILLALIALACVAGPWLAPHFGTDGPGRDLFSRTLEGGRVSLLAGVLATLVSAVIGVAWGAVAGYFGGRVDALLMRAVGVLHALPFALLAILVLVLFGRHFALVCVVVGAISWLDMARSVRGRTLSLRRREFVDAARLAGLPPQAIVRAHLVPNLLGVVIVCATLTVPQVILIESFLGFLGVGLPEPAASWGVLVGAGAADMEAAPWALLFPAGCLAGTVLCLNVLGDGLRQAFDPEGAGHSR